MFDFIHRKTDTAEIYFISNQENHWERFECSFRVRGKVPELWQPDTGRIHEQIVYDVVEGRTMLPLRLAPYGSVFVVFRDLPSHERVVSIFRNWRSNISRAKSEAEKPPFHFGGCRERRHRRIPRIRTGPV